MEFVQGGAGAAGSEAGGRRQRGRFEKKVVRDDEVSVYKIGLITEMTARNVWAFDGISRLACESTCLEPFELGRILWISFQRRSKQTQVYILIKSFDPIQSFETSAQDSLTRALKWSFVRAITQSVYA